MTNNKITDEFFPENKDDGDEYYVDDSRFFPIRRRKKKIEIAMVTMARMSL